MTVWVVFYYNGRYNFLAIASTLEAGKRVAARPNTAIGSEENGLSWEPYPWDNGQENFLAHARDGGEYHVAQYTVEDET